MTAEARTAVLEDLAWRRMIADHTDLDALREIARGDCVHHAGDLVGVPRQVLDELVHGTDGARPTPLSVVTTQAPTGAALGADPMEFILAGGDDHALLATFPGTGSVPEGWQVIGAVSEGDGVTVDGASYDGSTGWTHF